MDAQDHASQAVLQSFLEAVGDRVTPTTVSKATLTELCHALEDLVVTEDLAGTVIAGFQRVRFWTVERERFGAMTADPRRRAVVFTADDDDVATSVQHMVVGVGHPVAREWFVLTLNEAFSGVLFGRELKRSGEAAGGQRLFLTVWSFDPLVVDQLLSVLRASVDDVPGAAGALAAARAAHPPRHAAPGMARRYTSLVVERLEATAQRWLAAEAELAALRDQPTAVARPATEPAGTAPAEPRAAEVVPTAPTRERGNGATATAPDRAPVASTDLDSARPEPSSLRHALVLDGDPAMRGLLEALLRRAGWEVAAAATLGDAAAAARQTTFDVVLIDRQLADGDVRAPLEELERLQPGVRQLTAFLADEPPAARSLQGRPVIAKPVVWAELEHVLGTLTAAL